MMMKMMMMMIAALMAQFQPHQDMINSLEVFERNERLLIVSASSDCSVALCDVYGHKIGTFGQVTLHALIETPEVNVQLPRLELLDR